MTATIRPPAGTLSTPLNLTTALTTAATTSAATAIAATAPNASSFANATAPASLRQQTLFIQLQSEDQHMRTQAARELHNNVYRDQTTLTAVRPLLEMLCKDPTNSLASRYAHDGIRQYGAQATGIFLQALQDSRPNMRALGAEFLGALRSRAAIALLLDLLQPSEPINVRTASIAALAAICAHPSEPLSESTLQTITSRLIALTRDPSTDDGFGSLCMNSLEDLAVRMRSRGYDTHTTRLLSFMSEMAHNGPKEHVRLHAILALQRIGLLTPEVEATLLATLQDENDMLFGAAAFAVGVLRISAAEESLLTFLAGDNPQRRLLSVAPLGRLGSVRATNLLLNQLKDPDAFVRKNAAEALGRIGDKQVLPSLMAHRNNVDQVVRQYVHDAINVIQQGMPWTLRHNLR